MPGAERTVNCFANVVGHTGYALHARRFSAALDRLIPVCLAPKYGPLSDELLAGPWGTMLARLETIDLQAPTINLDYPEEMYRFGGHPRIGYTVFETDRVSAAGIHQLAQLDQVWVPTTWGRSVLLQHGLDAARVHVVPEGVDPTIFRPGLEPLPELATLEGFRFLAVGKWEARKGMVELLRAFDRAFPPDNPVWLLCHFTSHVAALQRINVAAEIDRLALRNRRHIVLIQSPLHTDTEMARLYNSAHAFVSASKAEGWGLPICEAMACGLPVIAPFYSGPTAYLTATNSYPLAVDALEDAYCPTFFPQRGTHGRWAVIDPDRLAALLRHVATHPTEARARGAAAAHDMHTRWTWDHAAQIARGRITPT
ncbi:MAG: glycosyltransferase [Deltaproteobacteria bacterium]|nr:glycosyltransferase [Deltaproteobacteria bacterium]